MALGKEKFKALWDHLQELRAKHKSAPAADVPEGIKLLHSMRAEASDESDFIALTTLLESECSWYGLKGEQELLTREMTEAFPEEPMPWISLAGYILHEKQDPKGAKTIIETALQKARNSGHFVRHTYNTRARIARRLRDYALLEDTLRELIAYVPNPWSQDVGYEDDFITDLPAGAISREVLERYRQIVDAGRKGK